VLRGELACIRQAPGAHRKDQAETGLPSGTVYPAMRRLERGRLILSRWEKRSIADVEQRPPRKYYKLTRLGRTTLEASCRRYPLLEKLIPAEEVEPA
jgi:PadR family transcriptional regulator PadR